MMQDKSKVERVEANLRIAKMAMTVFWLTMVVLAMVLIFPEADEKEEESIATATGDLVENGIHTASGLIAQSGYEAVLTNCGNCHSYKLVTQNRATREGWQEIIRWMQETQDLWDLGEQEPVILDYLATNYAPENKGRRENLTNIEWYELEN